MPTALQMLSLLLLPLAAPQNTGRCSRAQGPALLEAVRARYQHKSLKADFVQTYTDAVMGARTPERGALWVSGDGRMRFAYSAPERKIFVYDGHRASFEETAAKQITVLDNFERSQAALALRLLSAQGADPSAFSLTKNVASHADAKASLLTFVPAAGQAGFARAELFVQRASCEIERVRIVDDLGNVSEYALSARVLGGPMQEDTFVRQVPKGFDVLHVDVAAPAAAVPPATAPPR